MSFGDDTLDPSNEPKIKPEHVRAALMSAVGRDIHFPSIEFEEYVAKYLNKVVKF